MTTTSHLGLALVQQSQAQKEVTVNRALKDIDAILNTGAIDKDVATPPVSPSAGDVYLVAASATGDWASQDGKIAYFDDIWYFITPREGMKLWVNDEDKHYIYFNSAWNSETDHPRNYSQQQLFGMKTLTDGATINWDLRYEQVAEVTLAGNRTLANPTNGEAGGTYLLVVRQDATGSRTLNFGANYRFPGGTVPTMTSTANAVDVLTFVYDGTYMLGAAQQDFS